MGVWGREMSGLDFMLVAVGNWRGMMWFDLCFKKMTGFWVKSGEQWSRAPMKRPAFGGGLGKVVGQ